MKDKVVIITGGSSGIGKALAFEFGLKGSRLLITGRSKKTLELTEKELADKGITIFSVVADVSREEDNEKMVNEAILRYGEIDILINNAGVSMRALFEDLDLTVFRKIMEINFFGTVYATKYALPHILKSRGSIIGISSFNGRRGTPARTAYTASKHAMEGFLESLRTEVMKRGVHVLTVCPWFTASNIRQRAFIANGTAQGESPRDEEEMMRAEEVAHHIYRATLKRKRDLVLTLAGKFYLFLNKWLPSSWADNIVYNIMAKERNSMLK